MNNIIQKICFISQLLNLYIIIMYKIVISINVHENVNFLFKQLTNVKEYVKIPYAIIINCNDYMYENLKDNNEIKKMNNVFLNEKYFNKNRFHGTLTKGICFNMIYALNNFKFKYFLIMSSRNMFRLEVNDSNYNDFDKIDGFFFEDVNKYNCCITCTKLNENMNTTHINRHSNGIHWHWPKFIKSKLGEYTLRNNLKFGASYHEGLTFDHDTCISIINFLSKNPTITNDLFNFPACVEEFALQTLCCSSNRCFYHIGRGFVFGDPKLRRPERTFVYKTDRK